MASSSLNDPEKRYRSPSLEQVTGNNSLYNSVYDGAREPFKDKKKEEGLDSNNGIPVSDIVIEKLKQHVKQLESKLQMAYREIERLKLQNNPNTLKVELNAVEKNESEGRSTEPSSSMLHSRAATVTAVQQDEMTGESGSPEVKQEGAVGSKGTPGSSRNKTPRYWSCEEHSRFLEGLELYGAKDIKAISNHVGTRSSTQVRTHAQKYYLRLARELLRKRSLGSEVDKGKGSDKKDDAERSSEVDPNGSGSSDFSADDVCYDSLSGMRIPRAALEIAKQEARRLESKGVPVFRKGVGRNADSDSFGCNSYVNSPVFSEGYSGSNIDLDDSERISCSNEATTLKRSRGVEDVSSSFHLRTKYNNFSLDIPRESHKYDSNRAQSCLYEEEPREMEERAFALSDDLSWQVDRDRKVEEGLEIWQDSLVDVGRLQLPHFGHLGEHHGDSDVLKQDLDPFGSNILLSRLEREEPNYWALSQQNVQVYSFSRGGEWMRTGTLDNVTLDDEQSIGRSNQPRYSEDVKRVEDRSFLESKPTLPFYSESSSLHESSELERNELDQSFSNVRTTSFPKIFSRPFLSASFSSLGELEDTHNVEQSMFGSKSMEEIRD
jgi:SHAQKYF class myb-like DNA-binding protein